MKYLFLLLILFGCENNKPKFKVGDCLIGRNRNILKVLEIRKYSYKMFDFLKGEVKLVPFDKDDERQIMDCPSENENL